MEKDIKSASDSLRSTKGLLDAGRVNDTIIIDVMQIQK